MRMRLSTIGFVLALALSAPAMAQKGWIVEQDDAWCDDGGSRWGSRFCEVRTTTLDATGSLSVDADRNGGIRVIGWDRSEIELKAKVQVWRDSDISDAGQVLINTDGGAITVDAPKSGWSVSFRLMVPRNTDLKLQAHNGGISIREVEGQIRFDTQNGGIKLVDLAGDVQGRTQNGGVTVELEGNSWYGEGLNVRTQNGGVKLSIPEDFDAELTTGTVNGQISLDFPVMVQGKIGKRLSTTLGSGGAPVSVTTTNGGVRVERR